MGNGNFYVDGMEPDCSVKSVQNFWVKADGLELSLKQTIKDVYRVFFRFPIKA